MKKNLIKISIVVVAVLLVVIYFLPQPLDKIVNPNGRITIAQTVVNVVNGYCSTELFTYEFLPKTASYNKVMSIFSKYSYHRNLRSLFITSGMDYIKDSSYYVYFDNDIINKTMEFGGTGEIIINNHSYNMGLGGKSEQISFMNEIQSLLSKETPIYQS